MESKQHPERCERCGEILKKSVHLEYSQTDGLYYKHIPEGHVSQGTFPFGVACAKKELEVTRIRNRAKSGTP